MILRLSRCRSGKTAAAGRPPKGAEDFMTVQAALEKKLAEGLQPAFLEVINESPRHNVPEKSESHFLAVIVSEKFQGLSAIKRHRLTHSLVRGEIERRIHAFSLRTFTPDEWLERGGRLPPSPDCAKKT